MSKIASITVAGALLATTVLGASAAFAGGSYYKGASSTPINQGHDAARGNVDHSARTGAVGAQDVAGPAAAPRKTPPRRGDYYKGTNRPTY